MTKEERLQKERLQRMHVRAVKEIIRARSANGLLTDQKSLAMAVKFYIEAHINQVMLDGFYKGTIVLEERDGKTWVGNAIGKVAV